MKIFNNINLGQLPVIKIVLSRLENNIFERVSNTVLDKYLNFSLYGSIEDSFIIGTSTGILILHNNQISRLLVGSTYGITRSNDLWYTCQQTGRYKRIISFKLENVDSGFGCSDINANIIGLSPGVHQIDYFDDILYITDTYNNRIIIIKKKKKYFYPNGKLKNGRSSHNYNHFNSIFINDNKLYLIAHNESSKTKRMSEIYIYDLCNNDSIKLSSIITTKLKDAHNIVLFKGQLMYCNSADGSIMIGENIFFKNKDYLTRGLSLTEKYVVVGGSGFARRESRFSTDSIIWFLDHSGKELARVELKSIGQVYEIRCLNKDYGLSSDSKPSNKNL